MIADTVCNLGRVNRPIKAMRTSICSVRGTSEALALPAADTKAAQLSLNADGTHAVLIMCGAPGRVWIKTQ